MYLPYFPVAGLYTKMIQQIFVLNLKTLEIKPLLYFIRPVLKFHFISFKS